MTRRALVACVAAPALALLTLPAVARAQDCVIASRVVGHNDCGEFAAWDAQGVPRLVLGLGASLRTMAIGRMTFRGTAEHTDITQDYAIRGSVFHVPTEVAYTADIRLGWYVWRGLYIGGEMSLGGGGLPPVDPMAADNGLVVQPGGLGFFDTGAFVGVALPIASVMVLRAEVLAGGRAEWLGTQTTYNGEQLDGSAASAEWLIEPRGAVEFWLAPHVTTGVALGGDAWPRLNFYGGLLLQWHTRAYDGLHDRWSGS